MQNVKKKEKLTWRLTLSWLLQKNPQMNNAATRQMVSFPDRLDLIHRSIWDEAFRKHLKRKEGGREKTIYFEGDWKNLLSVTLSRRLEWRHVYNDDDDFVFLVEWDRRICKLSFASLHANAKKKAWCGSKIDVAWHSHNFLVVQRCSTLPSENACKDVPSCQKRNANSVFLTLKSSKSPLNISALLVMLLVLELQNDVHDVHGGNHTKGRVKISLASERQQWAIKRHVCFTQDKKHLPFGTWMERTKQQQINAIQ